MPDSHCNSLTAYTTANVVDASDANGTDATYTDVSSTAAASIAGTVHQYAHSEVMGVNLYSSKLDSGLKMYQAAQIWTFYGSGRDHCFIEMLPQA